MNAGLFVLFVGIVGGLWYWSWVAEKRRKEEMQKLAPVLGFSYSEQPSCNTSGMPLLERGSSRRARNGLSGSSGGHPVVVMDYKYSVGSGKNRKTRDQTVALFSEAGRGLPDFELGTEDLLHKIGQVFGYQDIDFADDPEFSAKFLLRGSDVARIQALFGAPLRRTCRERFGGWAVEVRGERVLVFRASRTVGVEEMRAFLSETVRIVDALRGRMQ